jgi:ubiquinone/menaquinone biosynthesis C-methylase UbiE
MANLIQHYEKYDEDIRLIKDKVHKIEYSTTLHILNKYIENNMNILDLGAGTGRYSFYYGEKGNSVTAVDIVPKHVTIMKEKLMKNKDIDIDINLGTATDLSVFAEGSFDVVLCLGPLYHLKTQLERDKCINECLRVLKKDGILAIAYINKLFITTTLIKDDNSSCLNEKFLNKIIDNGTVENYKDDTFLKNSYFFLPNEIEDYLGGFPTNKLEHVGTDGISVILNDMVNELSDEKYEGWMKYHLKICGEPSILGYSNHGLYVCRKK